MAAGLITLAVSASYFSDTGFPHLHTSRVESHHPSRLPAQVLGMPGDPRARDLVA